MVDAAKSLGFSAEAEARDRCQMQFLAQLMRNTRWPHQHPGGWRLIR
jgi:hypothetical protein